MNASALRASFAKSNLARKENYLNVYWIERHLSMRAYKSGHLQVAARSIQTRRTPIRSRTSTDEVVKRAHGEIRPRSSRKYCP